MEKSTISLQQVVAVLRMSTESRSPQISVAVFTAKDDPVLCKSGMEQVTFLLTASTAVQTYVAGDTHVAQRVFILLCEKIFSLLFLNGSTFHKSVLGKENAPAKASLPQSVLTATKASFVFNGMGNISSFLQDRRTHAELSWKMRGRTRISVQLVIRA